MLEGARMLMVSQASVLFLAVFLTGASAGEPSPAFSLSLSPCPGPVEAHPGGPWEREIGVILTTADNPDPQTGVTNWSISLSADGADITEITTLGTLAASVLDDPPGLRLEDGFERSRAGGTGLSGGDCEGRKGAVSAVALYTQSPAPAMLPPEGPALIARIKLAGTAPDEDGGRAQVSVFFLDGCRGDGGPVQNVVTWKGTTWRPVMEGCELEVTAVEPRFRRGDANGDGATNITDAIAVLGCKFSGEACPSCRDAADVNDDGTDNITDPIRLLNHLFIGDGPLPLPGPTECGVDPTPDTLAPCTYEHCGG